MTDVTAISSTRSPRPDSTTLRSQRADRLPRSPMNSPRLTIEVASRLAYSVDEAAALIGISRRSIYELLRSHQLGSIKIGSRRLIRHSDLERFLDDPEQEA